MQGIIALLSFRLWFVDMLLCQGATSFLTKPYHDMLCSNAVRIWSMVTVHQKGWQHMMAYSNDNSLAYPVVMESV